MSPRSPILPALLLLGLLACLAYPLARLTTPLPKDADPALVQVGAESPPKLRGTRIDLVWRATAPLEAITLSMGGEQYRFTGEEGSETLQVVIPSEGLSLDGELRWAKEERRAVLGLELWPEGKKEQSLTIWTEGEKITPFAYFLSWEDPIQL